MTTYISQKKYLEQDVVALAPFFLGKILCTNCNGHITKGIITETECYNGIHDKASHAYLGKKTKRNEAMYLPGGHSYVYICYGMHHMFNIVTATQNTPHAILVRNIVPIHGIDIMQSRHQKPKTRVKLGFGPGTVCKSMGITLYHNTLSLYSNELWIEENILEITSADIEQSTRIGIEYAEEDALLPWRFFLKKDIISMLIEKHSESVEQKP